MPTPQHSITAIPTFLCDDAFDWERAAEEAGIPINTYLGDDHPLVLYKSGETRYDLDAPAQVGDLTRSPRDYLKDDHGQPEWRLRRLRAREAAACTDLGGSRGELAAFALVAGDKPMTDKQVDEAVERYGLTAICEVGRAALRASSAPKAAEKKR